MSCCHGASRNKMFLFTILIEWDNRKLKMNIKITRKIGLFVSQLVPEKNVGRVKLLSQKNWYRLKCVLKKRHKRVD